MRNGVRLSSFEALRIVAMFLVLLGHANFFIFGCPMPESASTPLSFTVIQRYFLQNLALPAVNIFVLISGWFGIRPTLKSGLHFIFQWLFFILLLSLIGSHMHWQSIAKEVWRMLSNSQSYWFVKAYFALFLTAPILNKYVENSSKQQLRNVLITLFLFQTVAGFITDTTRFYSRGYSVVSFIPLYLLARYLRLYGGECFSFPIRKDCFIVLSLLITNTLLMTFCWLILRGGDSIMMRLGAYTNPIVIALAVYMLLIFSKLPSFYSPTINKIGKSAFAVYLFHMHALVIPFFTSTIQTIYNEFGILSFVLLTFLFLIAVFAVAVLIDFVRIWIYRFIEPYLLRVVQPFWKRIVG